MTHSLSDSCSGNCSRRLLVLPVLALRFCGGWYRTPEVRKGGGLSFEVMGLGLRGGESSCSAEPAFEPDVAVIPRERLVGGLTSFRKALWKRLRREGVVGGLLCCEGVGESRNSREARSGGLGCLHFKLQLVRSQLRATRLCCIEQHV
jgi:hypothetical protein